MGGKNTTGIKCLSLSTYSKNKGGHIVKRYVVNHKGVSRSFYFGKFVNIETAFSNACRYMQNNGISDMSMSEMRDIFKKNKHKIRGR